MHAELAPSAAERWVNCPGSVKAEQQYPDTESPESREGTAAHEMAAELLRKGGEWESFEGRSATNGVIFDSEMYAAACVFANDVRKRCRGRIEVRRFFNNPTFIEKRVDISRVHELNWGTPDCVVYDLDSNVLTIWDFKYGHGVVEVKKNWQLIEYAIGALDTHCADCGPIVVDMRIIQPRAYHPAGVCRSWVVNSDELLEYVDELKQSAILSQEENPPTRAGTWCKHCAARGACTTLQREAASIADRVEDLQLIDLSIDETALELKYLQRASTLLNARLGALEAQTLEQIRKGVNVPGYGIGYGRGSVNWSIPDKEVIALGDLIGVDLRKEEKPITPKQAENKKVDPAVIKLYSTSKQGSTQLVTNDKTIAGLVFGK